MSGAGPGDLPGVPDDAGQVGVLRRPPQVRPDPVAGGDELRRVPAPPRPHLDRHGGTGDLPDGVHDLLHGEAGAVAEVVDAVFAGGRCRQGQQVRVGEVLDVDVVADAGAVRGRVVLAVDGEVVARARRDLQRDRDEVGLRGVPLAQAEGGAGHVEVAQAHRGEAVGRRVGGQHVVDGQLRGAVGVGRRGDGVLADRHLLRLAVGGRGGGEDDPPAVGRAHRLEQRQRAADVDVPVLLRRLLRGADEALGREVQHRLGPDVGQHRRRVVQRRLDEPRPGRDGVGVPGREVVEHRDLVAALEQRSRDYAADVAGPTGDENAHAPTLGRTTVVVSARPAVQALPAYKPGRSPADVAREIGVERAVKLASNEVAFPPLPAVVQALATAAAETNRYPDNGAVVLTRTLAERYDVDPAQVVTGCGAVMLCQQLAQSYNDPGTSIAFAWRSFEMYPLLAQVAGARSIQVPLTPGRPGGPADTHDLEALAAAVDESTRLVFVCNPNNPTGTAVRRPELERFLDTVPTDILVVLDEAYREFATDPDVPDGLELMRGRPNVAVLRTFSKAWGLAGLRVGYLVAEDPAVADAVRKTHVPFSISSLAQAAAVAALASEPEVGRRCAAVVAERDRLTAALRDRGFDVSDSQANFVWLPVGEETAALAAALETRAVITRPFAGEGIRVTVGTPEEDDVFLAALDDVRSTAPVS